LLRRENHFVLRASARIEAPQVDAGLYPMHNDVAAQQAAQRDVPRRSQLQFLLAVERGQVDRLLVNSLVEARSLVESFPHRDGQSVAGRDGADLTTEHLAFRFVDLLDLAADEGSSAIVRRSRLDAEIGA